ncbi:MAG: hypothetical protein ABI837_09045, partial [Acidobacteriota bacterium]
NEGTGNTISVRATIADAEVGVKEAYVQLDGGAQVALTRSGPDYIATIPVPNVDGVDIVTSTLTITARDYEGNTSAPSINIRIKPVNDPNAPVVNWACTSAGAMYPAGSVVKLRVFAQGNNAGNTANGIQKIEIFVGGSTTALTPTAVSGQPNYYEVSYAVPANAVVDSTTSVRAVVTNVAGLTEGATTMFTVVNGRKITVDMAIIASDTSYDGQTVIVQSGTVTITGPHTFDNLVVLGGKVVHALGQKLQLTVTHTTYVGCDGAIDANDVGYGLLASYPGVTASTPNSAGSHIGQGGNGSGTSGATFGSVYRPQELGGGGAHSGYPTGGGGAVRLIGSTLVLDGVIRANGMQNMAAAGGSVWITAGKVSGKGRIEANGSSGGYAGGGGGAIAIEYTDPTSAIGTISAHTDNSQANQPTQVGGAGSIYLKGPSNTFGDLTLDNTGINSQNTVLPSLGRGTALAGSGGPTLVMATAPLAFFQGHWVEITSATGLLKGSWRIGSINGASVTLTPNVSEAINVEVGDTWQGVYRFDSVRAVGGETLRSADPIRIGNGGPITLAGPTTAGKYLELPSPVTGTTITVTGNVSVPSLSGTDITVKAGAKLTPSNGADNTQSVSVVATGTLKLESGASIDASDRGYDVFKSYPGVTASSVTSAGSHMGRGGINGGTSGATFGSVYQPQEAGAGASHNGYISAGGGVVRISAATAVIDGNIRANALAFYSGAGGSVWLIAGRISMTGSIQANGASGGFDAGAGGAIAVEYTDPTSSLGTMTAKTDASQASAQTQLGGAGSIYVKGPSSIYGDLTVDNGGLTGQPTELPSLGRGTAQTGSGGATLVLAAAPQPYFRAHWVDIVTPAGVSKGTWRIGSINGATITLTPNTTEGINVQVGDTWRGVYRLDSLKLRTTKLTTVDRLMLTTAADIGPGSSIVGNNQAAPVLTPANITLQSGPTGSAVIGTAGAVFDTDTPVTVLVTNVTTGVVLTATTSADGSFALPVQGNSGDSITLKARDSNANTLESQTITVGVLVTGTPVPSQVSRTDWTTDTAFLPRTLSRDGNYLAVASFPLSNGGSDKLVILNVADPSHPALVRTLASGSGWVRDVVVQNGFAYIASDRFSTLDLSNSSLTPAFAPDLNGIDYAVCVSNGYAFTAENAYQNNGTINIYDVTKPSTPRFLRQAIGLAGFGGFGFTDVLAYGNDYLIALSNNKPGNVGHDIMVIDRRDVNNLKKVAELDIPNFDAFRGTILGTNLYITSLAQPQTVVIDLSNPLVPKLTGTATMAAPAGGIAVAGRDGFAAATSAGLVTLDLSNPAAPVVSGSSPIAGSAFDVSLIGSYVYVANEQGIALVPATIAPQFVMSKISMNLTGTTLTLTGVPQAVTGIPTIHLDV